LSATSDRAADGQAPTPGAGWFGKIPALGDFASRRLPPHFVERWDRWLSTELSDGRGALGADWPPSYLEAPLWRFVLTPGLLDGRYWFGILMASADRVGRWYPLSLAASADRPFPELHAWWVGLARAALASREPGCDAEALDRAVLAAAERGAYLTEPAQGEPGLSAELAAAARGTSLWWVWNGDAATAAAWAVTGLPSGNGFRRLWQTAGA
jgi:type VI secretion system protein ImpM